MSEARAFYIHVPFCIHKCPYCDFYSTTDLSLIPGYTAGLEKEIRLKSAGRSTPCRAEPGGGQADTVYFGGGTPSLLDPNAVERILSVMDSCFHLGEACEITVEVNPGTVGPAYLSALKQAGVNRINIGVQSFDDAKLRFLGRIHRSGEAEKALEMAEKAGFDHIGIDLIYALPDEDANGWRADLAQALAHDPAHISCYMLTVEKGTPMYRRMENTTIDFPDSEKRGRLFVAASEILTGRGYLHYEVSNFARKPESCSRHNSRYWRYAPYDGFGPAAHAFDGEKRHWNLADTGKYVESLRENRLPPAGEETLTAAMKMTEMLMLGLRTADGIDIDRFNNRFGVDFGSFFRPVPERLARQGLGIERQGRFCLTLAGMACLDSILPLFTDRL